MITLLDRYKMPVNQLPKMKINPSASGTVSPESDCRNPKLFSHLNRKRHGSISYDAWLVDWIPDHLHKVMQEDHRTQAELLLL